MAGLWKPRKFRGLTKSLSWLKFHLSLPFTLFTRPSEVFLYLITPASSVRASLLCLLYTNITNFSLLFSSLPPSLPPALLSLSHLFSHFLNVSFSTYGIHFTFSNLLSSFWSFCLKCSISFSIPLFYLSLSLFFLTATIFFRKSSLRRYLSHFTLGTSRMLQSIRNSTIAFTTLWCKFLFFNLYSPPALKAWEQETYCSCFSIT